MSHTIIAVKDYNSVLTRKRFILFQSMVKYVLFMRWIANTLHRKYLNKFKIYINELICLFEFIFRTAVKRMLKRYRNHHSSIAKVCTLISSFYLLSVFFGSFTIFFSSVLSQAHNNLSQILHYWRIGNENFIVFHLKYH